MSEDFITAIKLAVADHAILARQMPTLQKPKRGVKSMAMKLDRTMPDNATWDDLRYQVYVRQKIEAGSADLKVGRKHAQDDIKREFGLSV